MESDLVRSGFVLDDLVSNGASRISTSCTVDLLFLSSQLVVPLINYSYVFRVEEESEARLDTHKKNRLV